MRPVPPAPRLLAASLAALCLAPPALAEGVVQPVGTALLFGEMAQIRLPAGSDPAAPLLLVLIEPGSDRVEVLSVRPGPAIDSGDDTLATFAPGTLPPTELFAGFAFPEPAPALLVQGGTVAADVTGDGVPDRLRMCLTMEALRFEVEDGTAAGVVIWQDYVPLGYDVEPTCG
jgi:hypothetical protein